MPRPRADIAAATTRTDDASATQRDRTLQLGIVSPEFKGARACPRRRPKLMVLQSIARLLRQIGARGDGSN